MPMNRNYEASSCRSDCGNRAPKIQHPGATSIFFAAPYKSVALKQQCRVYITEDNVVYARAPASRRAAGAAVRKHGKTGACFEFREYSTPRVFDEAAQS